MFSYSTVLTALDLKSAIVHDPLIVGPSTLVIDAIAQMSGVRSRCQTLETAHAQLAELHLQVRSSCVMVVEGTQLVGILTERDVVRLSAEQQPLDQLEIAAVMARPVITLPESAFTDLFFAVNLLQQYHIRHLPIVDAQAQLVGLVSHESLRQVSRPVDLLRLRLVSEVMTSAVVYASPDCSMLEIAQRMAASSVSSVMVVQPGDAGQSVPVGIITERDLVQFQALGLNLNTCQAQSVMSTPIFAVSPSDSLWVVQQIMEQRFIHRLAVTGQQGQLLGIVTQTSLLQALNPLEIYNLAEVLEHKVTQLEAEKVALLEHRTAELEQQVALRADALKAKADQEQIVAAIALQIRSSLSLQTILETTTVQVRQVLGCDRVSIWRFETDWQSVVVAESTDSPLSLTGRRIDDCCFKQERAEIYRQGRIRVVPDIHTTEMTDCHRQMLVQLQTRAKILVPLLCGDQLWGLLNVSESQFPRQWTSAEVELLQALSVQLAIALQQSTAYHQLQSELAERQRVEAALRASEQRYITLTAAAPVGIFRADAQGNCTYVNERWCQITGLSPEAAAGHGWRQALHPEDRQQVEAEWSEAAKVQQPFRLEYRFKRADGVSWVYGQAVAEHDAAGQLIGYVGTITDVSVRKQAEAALIQSEANSRAVLAAIPDFLFKVSADGVYRGFVTANRSIDLLSAEFDYTGLRLVDILPPEIAARHLHYIEQALRTGELQIYEQQVQIGDRLQDEEVRVIKSAEAEVLFMIRDISDRRQAELDRQRAAEALEQLNAELEQRVEQRTLELQEREAQLQDFFDNANDLIQSVLLESGRFEYVNRAWCQTLGYSAEEVDALTIFDVLHPVCQRHCQSAMAEMQAGRLDLVERIELTFLNRAGQPVLVEGSINCRYDAGQPVATRAIFRDITARKKAEAQLQEQEQFLRSIYDGVNYPIFVIEIVSPDQFVYIDWNATAERESGIAASEIIGKTPEQIYGVVSGSLERQRLQQCLASQSSITYEEELEFPSDRKSWWLTTLNPLKDSAGNVYRIVGTTFNITELKEAERTIHHQIERETLLREITQRIRQSLDLQTIFETACQEIRQVLQADRVGIFRLYPDSQFDDGEFVAEAVLDGFPSVVSMRVHDHCFGENYAALYAKGRFYVVDDIYNNGVAVCHADILAQFQVRANLVMPLLCGDLLWGLLCIHQCTSTRSWQQSEIDFTQQIANQLAIAIQQANLYEQIQSELWVRQQTEAKIAVQLRQQKALGAIIQQIRESLDINEILATVTQQVKDVMHSDRVIVFRLFANGNSQIVEESVSPEFPSLKAQRWENEVWSQEILDVYWQGKPRIVPDVTNDTWTDCLLEYSQQGQIKSKIVAPILQDRRSGEDHRWVAPWQTNQLWGVLVVHACGEQRLWHEAEAQLLQQIANQLAVAIQQASLFSQLQQELKERQQAEAKLTESNQQLAISNQELARATRLKDEFLANMSHELRTPLNAILGMAEGLQEKIFGEITEKQLKAFRTIERSGSHLLELINDILDVAKIESGQIELDLAPTPISLLCQSSLSFIKQQALQKQIQIGLQLQYNLPDLWVDERRIRQVLINLLNNAVKFTPEGGKITLQVTSTASREGKPYLRISVTDTGIGISAENIKKLFQPFIQIDSALNRQYQGTGLGLALVKRIVDLHGGCVDLTSELGQGSCFAIELPCVSTPSSSHASVEGSLAAEVLTADGSANLLGTASPLILLAEDNEANINTVSSYLKAKNYRVLWAGNGQEAIELAKEHQPDLILMDVQMPGMDGLEATRQIRACSTLAQTPIVALTALAMVGDRERCLEAGANDYLTKPVKLKQLVSTIQQLLANRKLST